MRKIDPPSPREIVTFHCRLCRLTWDEAPARVVDEDDPAEAHHPWRYFAVCTSCGEERAQAHWQRALLKAWTNRSGPKTPEGKAAVTANLAGHPTPEEAKRTRFNRMTHGLYAKVATYFPAKPDGYSFCSSCDVDRAWCRAQPACVKRAEHFMLHHAAFEQNNPRVLNGVYSSLHAALTATLQQILQTIIADGVKITVPVWYHDKDGGMHLAEYVDQATGEMRQITEITAHPLFKPLGELISRAGLSLSDMGITNRIVDQREEPEDLGQIRSSTKDDDGDYRTRQLAALENLAAAVERAAEKTRRDPILIEHQAQQGGGSE
jgi:hypothetical protein